MTSVSSSSNATDHNLRKTQNSNVAVKSWRVMGYSGVVAKKWNAMSMADVVVTIIGSIRRMQERHSIKSGDNSGSTEINDSINWIVRNWNCSWSLNPSYSSSNGRSWTVLPRLSRQFNFTMKGGIRSYDRGHSLDFDDWRIWFKNDFD